MENYSNYYVKSEKKVPSIVVLSIIVGMVFAVNAFISRPTVTKTEASPTKIDKFEFSNVTNNSVTIFWRTQNATTGWIVYGQDAGKTDTIAFDKRDFEADPKKYNNHYIEVKSLNDNTKYFFYLVIDNKIIKNSAVPLTFTTKNKITAKSNSQPAIGKVVGKNSLPLDSGIVTLRIAGMGALSTMTETTGEWIIPTYFLTKLNTNEQFFPSDETPVKIEVIDELGNTSLVDTIFNKISPVPQTIKLGENMSLTNPTEQVLGATTNVNETATAAAVTTTPTSTPSNFEINFPKENASIDGGKPLFKGTAPIGSKLLAQIISQIKQDVSPSKYYFYPDNSGKWSYSPLTNIGAGNYTFKISYLDDKNKEKSATRSFTIIKSGEAVLGSATPEATITATATPTVTVTVSISKKVTPTSPVSGGNTTPLVIGSIALTIIGLGLVLIF